MAGGKVAFELVAPQQLLVAEDVDMVVVPGGDGDFGVLPGHAPLISTVRPGILDVYQGGKISRRIFVAGGFAEVTDDRCTVLAERAQPVERIERAAAEATLKNLQEDLADAKGMAAREAILAEIAITEAMLWAAGAAAAPAAH